MQTNRQARRHHYLPQMYLRGFADQQELVWVYDRQTNAFRHQGIVNTAVEKDFYTIVGADGEKTDAIERGMADMVESPTKHIIDRLDKRQITWPGEERAIFALFIALLRTRNPAFDRDQNDFVDQFERWRAKASHPTVEAVEESLRQYKNQTGKDLGLSAQEIFAMIRDDNYELRNPRQNNIKIMVTLAPKLAQALFQLDWDIFTAPKGMSFVTCDNPFTVVPSPSFDGSTGEGFGILTPGSTTMVPLSAKTAIGFRGYGGRYSGSIASKEFVRNVNVVVAGNSERFVIAKDEALLRHLVRKTKLGEWQPEPRVKINAPDPY